MQNGQVYLHVLSEVAALLQLKNTETSSYLSAMSDLERQLYDAQSDVAAMRVVATSGQRRSQELLTESSHLEHVQRHLDDTVTERELHGIIAIHRLAWIAIFLCVHFAGE